MIAYGLSFPDNALPQTIELVAFNRALNGWEDGLGAYQHLHNAIDLIWNEPRRLECEKRRIEYDPDKHDAFIWNEWTEGMMGDFCAERESIVAGPGASWKSTCAAMFFLCYWACDPMRTRVIITSTTGDGLRARVWKEITHFYRALAGSGNLVQSRTMIQTIKGDDGAGIFGIAVESDGNIEKAVGKIIGRHNANMGVFIDEMPTVNSAIVDGGVNLEKGCERFRMVGVGNPNSRFDEHGKAAEPETGWDSVNDRTGTWRTKRGGKFRHLDGRNSPRNRDASKFPGMICEADLERSAKRDGDDSPKYWQQSIGFWPPEGISKTVLTETMIIKFHAKEPPIWEGDFECAAGFDPSFEGGDRKMLWIVHYGKLASGQWAIAFHRRYLVNPGFGDDPLNFRTVAAVKKICEDEGVKPERFGMDSTGAGAPLADIFMREWSPRIIRVKFGGNAPDRPISESDSRKQSDEYFDQVTALWYGFAVLTRNDHIRGLDIETALEFCQRYYELEGRKVAVESKKDMKKRTGQSPDNADAAVVAAEVVVQLCPELGGNFTPRAISGDWAKRVREYRSAYSQENAYRDEDEYAEDEFAHLY